MLGVLHAGIAMATNAPEMALEDDEAQLLAKATVPVLEQFQFVPDPRYAAVFGLLMAAGKIYAPRVYLIRARLREEADVKKNRPPEMPTVPLYN